MAGGLSLENVQVPSYILLVIPTALPGLACHPPFAVPTETIFRPSSEPS